jgi:hypothetical protein
MILVKVTSRPFTGAVKGTNIFCDVSSTDNISIGNNNNISLAGKAFWNFH